MLKVDDLTRGEELWIWRQRQGLNLVEAAERHNMTRKNYMLAEHGDGIAKIKVTPTLSETIRVLRRRSKKTRDELCEELGICHVTWLKWERDPKSPGHKTLVDYWTRATK